MGLQSKGGEGPKCFKESLINKGSVKKGKVKNCIFQFVYL
jgi:hypothetical protein